MANARDKSVNSNETSSRSAKSTRSRETETWYLCDQGGSRKESKFPPSPSQSSFPSPVIENNATHLVLAVTVTSCWTTCHLDGFRRGFIVGCFVVCRGEEGQGL